MPENTPPDDTAVNQAEKIFRENSPVEIKLDEEFARQLEGFLASRIYGPTEVQRRFNKDPGEQKREEVRQAYEDLGAKLNSSIGNLKDGAVSLKIAPSRMDVLLADLLDGAIQNAYSDPDNKTTGSMLKTLAVAYQRAGGIINSKTVEKFIAN